MLKLNLKIALRSLWKNKMYAFISITGLALAIAIFILSMLYADYEKSYDVWNPDYKNVYRVNYKSPTENVALSPGNLATFSKEKIAAVTASTRIQEYWGGDMLVNANAKTLYLNGVLLADSNFLKVFQYPLVYGDINKALSKPGSVILSKKTSEIIFGKGVNPIGETIKLDKDNEFTVDAVIDEAALPSHFRFNMIRRFRKSASQDFYTNNFYTYVKLNPQSDLGQTEKALNTNRVEILNAELSKLPAEQKNDFREFITENKLYLQPIAEIHLTKGNIEYEFANNGIGKYINLMFIVAVLVLVIAAVNFTNLSITMATGRAKETGIRKVLGAHRAQIGIQFIIETAVQCTISLIAAMIIAELLMPSFSQMIGQTIQLEKLTDYYKFSGQIFTVLIILVLVIGLYPALIISNVVPAKVLKGNFANSNSGSWIRNGLIVIQFSIAVLFIAGVWVINSQLTYMQKKDLGYNANQVVAVNIMTEQSSKHYREISNRLKDIEGITSISRTDHLPGEDMGGNSYTTNGTSYNSNFLTIDVGYFNTMGMKLIEGRAFSSTNPGDTLNSIILTETAAKYFNLHNPVGKKLRYGGRETTVIGLVKDFNHYSPEKNYQPIAFHFLNGNPLRYLLIRINPENSAQILKEIENAWTGLEPGFPIRYTLLDRNFESLLKKQAQLKQIIGFLSTVTIMLALMGIFAIAAFTTQRRSKEINIRKVLGASIMDILTLLNKGFARLVILANIIALPLAYFILKSWLAEFAFRIDMPVLPFILSIVISLFLTVIVVSLQSFKTANSNPVEGLKNE